MSIEVERKGQIVILSETHPVVGTTDPTPLYFMRGEVRRLLRSGDRFFVIDISNFSFVDSALIAEMVGIYKVVLDQDGIAKFVISSKAEGVFEQIRLDKVIKVFATQRQALASFEAQAK